MIQGWRRNPHVDRNFLYTQAKAAELAGRAGIMCTSSRIRAAELHGSGDRSFLYAGMVGA